MGTEFQFRKKGKVLGVGGIDEAHAAVNVLNGAELDTQKWLGW